MRFPVLLLAVAVLLAGCGEDDPVVPVDTSFSFTVKVVDASGAPVEGVNVNIVNDVFVDADKAAEAMVALPVFLLERALVRVVVRDIEGETVRTAANISLEAGRHLVYWDGLDDDGVAQPSGRYTLAVLAFPPIGSIPLYSGSVDVMLQRSGASFVLGTTGADGKYRTTDLRILPALYYLPSMTATNAIGQRLGSLQELATATVTVWRDGEPAVWDAIAVESAPNSVTITYDTSDFSAAAADVAAPLVALPAEAAKADDPEWGIGDPYPNPFH